jgi:acetolactate synthase-1/3 small subunit
MMTQSQHSISILVANKPGVLMRVAQVFTRRQYNIDSLVVSPALDGKFSRMTIGAEGDPATLGQIIKQLQKLIDVKTATEHLDDDTLKKELALIKLSATPDTRTEILQLVRHFKAQTVDFTEESMIIEVTGNSDKLDAMIGMLKKFGILELVRTGKVVMARGSDAT